MPNPTVIMPVWIIGNDPTDPFIHCLLGSEPTATAKDEKLPRACIVGRPTTIPANLYAGLDLPRHLNGLVLATLQVDMSKVPDDILDRIAKGLQSGQAKAFG